MSEEIKHQPRPLRGHPDYNAHCKTIGNLLANGQEWRVNTTGVTQVEHQPDGPLRVTHVYDARYPH